MSGNEENAYFQMIYKRDKNDVKIFDEFEGENFGFEMIYKPNENKKEIIKRLKKLKEQVNIFLDTEKDYSGEVFRILGKKFVKNNKNKCILIYKNKKYALKEYFEEIDNNYKNKGIIKLKLYGINNISDMSRMFYGCYYLSSVSDYPKRNERNINNLNDNFSESNSYLSINEET